MSSKADSDDIRSTSEVILDAAWALLESRDDAAVRLEDVARRANLGIIRQFVGHGIGTAMHEEPQVPNYRTGRPGRKLEPGICLAIEPMFTLGGHDTSILADDWTVVTRDGSLAAHFEHSIAVTADGPQILTVA